MSWWPQPIIYLAPRFWHRFKSLGARIRLAREFAGAWCTVRFKLLYVPGNWTVIPFILIHENSDLRPLICICSPKLVIFKTGSKKWAKYRNPVSPKDLIVGAVQSLREDIVCSQIGVTVPPCEQILINCEIRLCQYKYEVLIVSLGFI